MELVLRDMPSDFIAAVAVDVDEVLNGLQLRSGGFEAENCGRGS